MKLFLVTYDLAEPGKDYPSLTKELERLGRRIALSVWMIEISLQTAEQVRDALHTHMDWNDRLVVIEIPDFSDWATVNAIIAGKNILKRHCP